MNMYVGPNKKVVPMPETDDQGTKFEFHSHESELERCWRFFENHGKILGELPDLPPRKVWTSENSYYVESESRGEHVRDPGHQMTLPDHNATVHGFWNVNQAGDLLYNGAIDTRQRRHDLKADRTPYESLMNGTKKAEVRYDDRDYRGGDVLIMRETVHSNLEMKRDGLPLLYTGRVAAYRVTHIQRGYGLPTDMVVMSVEFMCAYPIRLHGYGNYTADARL